MAGLADRIYSIAPVWLQQIGVTLYGLRWRHVRYGGAFQKGVRDFTSRETYLSSDWHYYQTNRLRDLLVRSARTVPYYRKVFSEAGFTERDLADFSLSNLEQLPLLSKETIRKQPKQFIATTFNPRRLQTYLTSGTTGTPLEIVYSAEMHQLTQAAYEVRARHWAGLNYKMSRAMIGGRMVVRQANAKPPFWRYNLVEHQLYMSAFHISPANVPHYVQALNHYRPDYLVGYASSHYFLARMIQELDLDVYQPRAVLTSSEKLMPEMRKTIQATYLCPVFDGYSAIEGCCLVTECEHHRMHISPDVGIIELLDSDGNPVAPGQPGEIVATGFLNLAQPLIRYRTGDTAILSTQACPCGRQMPILEELTGRIEDTVVGSDGRELVRFHGIFVGIPNIREGQVIQEALGQFRIRLVVDAGFNEADRMIIRARFLERLGPIELKFEYVDQIERTQSGKFRAVISNVSHTTARQPLEADK